jgi:hypothetical protein
MGSFCPNLKLKIMEDNRTELQKKFEEQTPTIKGVGRVEYLQTFVSWLHLQVERCEGQKLPIHDVSGTLLWAVEFGYKQCEKGNNIQMAVIEWNKLNSNDR